MRPVFIPRKLQRLPGGKAREIIGAIPAAGVGLSVAEAVISGDAGLGQAMSNGPVWDDVATTLGDDFHISRLTFKNHIGCGHTFAAIDGALALQALHGVAAEDISRVHVGTYQPALDIACYERPATANEARFSLKYVVASALVHGSVRMAAFESPRLEDAITRALMERMTVAVDPELDAAFPAQRAARIQLETKDGQSLSFLQPNRMAIRKNR